MLRIEVQAVPGWERFVARLFEKKRYRLTLTGSSSKLLSKEIATSLRGLDPEQAGERELRGLFAALDAFTLERGTIITADDDREETKGDKHIRYIPLWRWLLGPQGE
jgi:predicted AAA+ superfamily ATPase